MGTGNDFIKKTKYQRLKVSPKKKGKQTPSIEADYPKDKCTVRLPKPDTITVNTLDIRRAIEDRRSIREYSDEPLTLEELSYLLWCTQGIKKTLHAGTTLRTVPSAGARHAFETYLLINNVDDLKSGLYRYLAVEHRLLVIDVESDVAERLTKAALGQPIVATSAVTFIWCAVPFRMTWRYNERGYRYLFLDAGHVCQNLYLAAQAVDCGTCAIAAFLDDDINTLLSLDGKSQFTIYMASVGKILQ